MTDEQNNIPSEEEIREVAHSVSRPDQYVQGEAAELAKSIDPKSSVEKGVLADAIATEKASTGPVAQGWDSAITSIQKGIESTGKLPDSPAEALSHGHDDTVTLPLVNMNVPLYTGVFVGLGVLTLIEVVISFFPPGALRIIALLGIALAKAALVVYYYMHLKSDGWIFRLTLFVPVMIVVLSMMFLLLVPAGY